MSSNTTYLITGANRGIGFGIVSTLLQRANTTVIVTVRSGSTDVSSLKALPKADGSNLIIANLEISTTSVSDIGIAHEALVENLKTQGIERIDVLIANAGSGTCFKSTVETPLGAFVTDFYSNTLGPIALYQHLLPFLKASDNAKFVIIGSILGSIEAMMTGAPTAAYGATKAAVHYAAKKIHGEEEKIVVLTVHPGWVQTKNGQNFADSIGVPAPPMTVEQSSGAVVALIDSATKTTTSGTFVGYDGAKVPW
ncbi:uncharacterized protein EAE98_010945 [Botrytis deweyae]|uniref:NAD(P)-binding protein n=2 Tax=Botrytis TaxID=33196 RepID=A0A4Z1JQP8_9HELO|nr:uncharacterized protein EAE98_010945 [Botrytis deweyae]KAF7915865.1 hypothetical protein EAE98_010945 [Botrytis deweyae]KAF7923643.1 hypothetical protein EAE99_006902 [Botrytis elliptica]TGO73552.1 hypothetical protein BELL_0351g00020 [Botrytis elliptica]